MDNFWGKPEVFWVGLQALCAVAGLIGLFFYTLYTRRMMKMQLETRRSEITPVFSPRGISATMSVTKGVDNHGRSTLTPIPNSAVLSFQVRNIGRGPAVLCHAWHRPSPPRFSLDRSAVIPQSTEALPGKVEHFELLPGETMNVQFEAFDPNRVWLFMLTCTDTANGRHQLQVMRDPDQEHEQQWRMQHQMGDTLGERIVAGVQRFVEIMRVIDYWTKRIPE